MFWYPFFLGAVQERLNQDRVKILQSVELEKEWDLLTICLGSPKDDFLWSPISLLHKLGKAWISQFTFPFHP